MMKFTQTSPSELERPKGLHPMDPRHGPSGKPNRLHSLESILSKNSVFVNSDNYSIGFDSETGLLVSVSNELKPRIISVSKSASDTVVVYSDRFITIDEISMSSGDMNLSDIYSILKAIKKYKTEPNKIKEVI